MNSKQKKALRKKLYVDREVQFALILRSILHWHFYMCAILLTVVIFTVIRDPSQNALILVFQSFRYFSPAILAAMLLLPLVIYDTLKASHKVAGPIIRLRNEMSKLADGEEIDKLRFRDGDHWAELAADFNVFAEKIMEERRTNQIPNTTADLPKKQDSQQPVTA